jgi:hypothetical protein
MNLFLFALRCFFSIMLLLIVYTIDWAIRGPKFSFPSHTTSFLLFCFFLAAFYVRYLYVRFLEIKNRIHLVRVQVALDRIKKDCQTPQEHEMAERVQRKLDETKREMKR